MIRFLADQDVYQVTVNFLKQLGHDVIRAAEVVLANAKDEEILSWAHEDGRILLTRDKDFGALVFLSNVESSGVVLLRIDPLTITAVHAELKLFLQKHAKLNFQNIFCVVEPGLHRIRFARNKAELN